VWVGRVGVIVATAVTHGDHDDHNHHEQRRNECRQRKDQRM
jgi:hypothetical protein